MSEHSIQIAKAAKVNFEKRKKNHRVRDGKPVTDEMYNPYRKGFKDGYWHGLDKATYWMVSEPKIIFTTKEKAVEWVESNIETDTQHLGADTIRFYKEGNYICMVEKLRFKNGDRL